MASMPYKQDLPPEGGYAPINYKRIPAKSVLNAPIIFGGLFGTMAYGYWSYKRGMRAYRKEVSKSFSDTLITEKLQCKKKVLKLNLLR